MRAGQILEQGQGRIQLKRDQRASEPIFGQQPDGIQQHALGATRFTQLINKIGNMDGLGPNARVDLRGRRHTCGAATSIPTLRGLASTENASPTVCSSFKMKSAREIRPTSTQKNPFT